MDFSDYVRQSLAQREQENPADASLSPEGQQLIEMSRSADMDEQMSSVSPEMLRSRDDPSDGGVSHTDPVDDAEVADAPEATTDSPGQSDGEEAVPEEIRMFAGHVAEPEIPAEDSGFRLSHETNHSTQTERMFVPSGMEAQFNEILQHVDQKLRLEGDSTGFADSDVVLPDLPEIPESMYRDPAAEFLSHMSREFQLWERK